MKQLIELGKEKGYLLFDEIYELLPEEIVAHPDELGEVYARLQVLQILVIDRPERYQNRDEFESPVGEFDKKDDDTPEFTLSAHEKTNDPVRMYLREMGTVPLLDRDGEVEIAQRIEQGEWTIYEALCNNQLVLRELLRLHELAQKDKTVAQALAAEADEPLDSKAADRIKRNLRLFEQIAANDEMMRNLRKKQKRQKREGERYQEIEREVDRLLAKIAKDIRTIDFSVQTRNQLVNFLKGIDQEFSRHERELRRAQNALRSDKSNPELEAMHKRRIEKYRAKLQEVEERYGTNHAQVAKTIDRIRQGEMACERAKEELIVANLRLVVS
ncbi:MAG: hypothetical protein KDD47_17005, partial [Acidobacteria bacterium]|nr:hypothetical protein [Acidobacteriota bacterium]